jgi:Sulfatase-modifying factor enzyme 1
MRVSGVTVFVMVGLALSADPAHARKCKNDAVRAGTACVDKYEASVWEIPPANTRLVKNVLKSKVTSAGDMTGGTQRGATGDDYGAGCPDTADGCTDFYAVSIPGVTPSQNITWFQAAAACRNAQKRLATNQEWQMAALGTPDPGTDDGVGDCNISAAGAVLDTGSRDLCVSDTGAFDMVGNVWEWVADWGDQATGNSTWSSTYGNDSSIFGGDGSLSIPGAFLRGGYYGSGTYAGVFAVASDAPYDSSFGFGFRCAREP